MINKSFHHIKTHVFITSRYPSHMFITYLWSSLTCVHHIPVLIKYMHLSYSWPSHVFITSMCSSHTCRERRLQMAIYFCMLHINTNQIIFVYIVQTNHMSHYLQLTVGRQHSVFISVCLYFIVIKQECTESLHEPSLIYTYSAANP